MEGRRLEDVRSESQLLARNRNQLACTSLEMDMGNLDRRFLPLEWSTTLSTGRKLGSGGREGGGRGMIRPILVERKTFLRVKRTLSNPPGYARIELNNKKGRFYERKKKRTRS